MPKRRTDLVQASVLVVATAAIFPAWSVSIAGRAQQLPAHIDLPDVRGWHRVALSTRAPWAPYYPGADHTLFGRYADASGETVDLAIAVYGRQREGAKLAAFGTGVIRQEDRWVRVADLPDLRGGAMMRITAPGPVERIVGTWYRVGHATTHDPLAVKLATLEARLLGGPQRAVAVHLSTEAPTTAPMARFLAALGPIDRLADTAAGMP